MIPLAHSARHGCPEQTYHDHVANVLRDAVGYAQAAARFSRTRAADFLGAVEMATAYHDLGKLDPLFQDDLRENHLKTRINHVDAGAAHLLSPSQKQGEAAYLVCSHHRPGLRDLFEEQKKIGNGINWMFRDCEPNEATGTTVREHIDANLSSYLNEHHRWIPVASKKSKPGFTGLMRRLALSCLVDADHGDTARHYGNECDVEGAPLRAGERLKALDAYVEELGKTSAGSERERDRLSLRQRLYAACRNRELAPDEYLVACESPVGTGKTTAVMAHLLSVAAERGLRRIFVVLPFTNIIDQSVKVYRDALVLPGENAEEIVAAHHHRVEFDGEGALEHRLLSQRWEAPIIVTTAVQFFETLAACSTSALRKLHRLPGSCLFIDETHAAMPAPLWPQMWRWLEELGREWSCHSVFASGSLARFWEMREFFPSGTPGKVVELVESATLREQARTMEQRRVQILSEPQRQTVESLGDLVLSKAGPRLVIFNTVQSAAVFASHLRESCGVTDGIEHLSTALTPLDRAETVERVRARLRSDRKDWCLVATSCVEAGVDFSFRTAFRESCGLVNLLQIAGRVNRHEEYSKGAPEVWDFRHVEDGLLNLHPDFKLSRQILAGMFAEGVVAPTSIACGEAMRRELSKDYGRAEEKVAAIHEAERKGQYPVVADLCRIIGQDTRTVVICPQLAEDLSHLHPSKYPPLRQIMERSVQIWATRLDAARWPVKPIGFGGDLWAWTGAYDSFVGYMAGVIPLLKAGQKGFDTL